MPRVWLRSEAMVVADQRDDTVGKHPSPAGVASTARPQKGTGQMPLEKNGRDDGSMRCARSTRVVLLANRDRVSFPRKREHVDASSWCNPRPDSSQRSTYLCSRTGASRPRRTARAGEAGTWAASRPRPTSVPLSGRDSWACILQMDCMGSTTMARPDRVRLVSWAGSHVAAGGRPECGSLAQRCSLAAWVWEWTSTSTGSCS